MNKYTIILHNPDKNNKNILHELRYKIKANSINELNNRLKSNFCIYSLEDVVIEQC